MPSLVSLVESVIAAELRSLREAGPTGPSSTTGTDETTAEPQAPPGTPPEAMADPGTMTAPTGAAEVPDPTVPAPTDTPKEPEPPPASPPEAVLLTAEEESKKTSSTPAILKVLKAGVQGIAPSSDKAAKALSKSEQLKLVGMLSTHNDPTLKDAGSRLRQYIQTERTMTPQKRALVEQKLRAIVAKVVDRKVRQLKESGELADVMSSVSSPGPAATSEGDANFDAVRSLGLKAQETALSFESDIRKELDLLDPNKMDKESQQTYATAMQQFHMTMVAAVNDVVNSIKGLPKNVQDTTQVTQ